jgi:hypothetical protein
VTQVLAQPPAFVEAKRRGRAPTYTPSDLESVSHPLSPPPPHSDSSTLHMHTLDSVSVLSFSARLWSRTSSGSRDLLSQVKHRAHASEQQEVPSVTHAPEQQETHLAHASENQEVPSTHAPDQQETHLAHASEQQDKLMMHAPTVASGANGVDSISNVLAHSATTSPR